MNALPVPFAQAVVPPAPPSPVPGDGTPADQSFEGLLAAAAQALDPTRTDPREDAEAADAEASGGQDADAPAIVPDLPWLSQWASYLAPPTATQPLAGSALAPDAAPDASGALAPAAALASTEKPVSASPFPGLAEQDAPALATNPAAGVAARPDSAIPVPGMAPDAAGRRGERIFATSRAQVPAAPQPEAAEPAARDASADPSGVLQASSTVPVSAPPSHHSTAPAARGEAPTVPGAPVPLHAGALQDRIDTALRWMAAGHLQTAQLRVDPEALGPITIHLRLDGEAASVVFGSNHESTRQMLESSLSGLKDVLATHGLSLGQASVGSEQQSGFLAARQFAEREAPRDRGASAEATGPAAGTGTAGDTVRPRAVGNGMVDLYA